MSELNILPSGPSRAPGTGLVLNYGESKYGFLGRVYEMEDFTPPSEETLHRLRAIIDEAFGRSAVPAELVAPQGNT